MIANQPTERLIGFAQIVISVLFLIGYFGVLAAFLLGWIKTPDTWRDALIALIGVITGSVGTIMGFWFSRGRPVGASQP
jgi:protein-S-isoprenylcysteine O-methyltransferase Ste14